MIKGPSNKPGRAAERIFLLFISAILLFLFNILFDVLKQDFNEVPSRISKGTMINLNDPNPGENIRRLLSEGHYFSDQRDINLVAETVGQQLNADEETINNIGELNKRKYFIDAEKAWNQGGESFQKRVRLSRSLVGFAGEDSVRYEQEKTRPPSISSTTDVSSGNLRITGTVQTNDDKPVAGVLVRLQMLLPEDSIYSNHVTEVEKIITEKTAALSRTYALDSTNKRQLQSLAAFARTNADGFYIFTGLPANRSFQVLPLQPGFQFGSSKGTENLDDDEEFNFFQSKHSIRLLSTRDFNNLKKEKSLIVRTPEEATEMYWTVVIIFFAGFILLHLLLSIRFPAADQVIVPVIMLLTGLSFLTLLSLQDPLRDRFLGYSSAWQMIAAFAGLYAMLFLNVKKFTTDSRLYRMFVLPDSRRLATGWQWAGLAALLLMLTIVLGSGPEGSGVKVNLFGFQPSEIVKFILLLFLAGFFSVNERFITEYATFSKRWSFFSFALAAILVAILLFLMLGDLGPAIVICFTFIILFSFSRGDFNVMCGSVLVYVICNWQINNVWIATGVTALLLAAYLLLVRKQLSESAIMALVVMSGFMLLDQVPFLSRILPGPVQRLIDRKAIWQNNWDNEVFGGDQVANGIWAMSGGGITGQGVGQGFAKTIPEAHTDMILPSIGEEFGWTGIVCIFILFLVFLHRSILIGRQTGTPFLFYLSAGIGVATFVQFLLIAGGSTGVFPLSGVSLPFISYGGSSLIANMLAAGFLLSASLKKGTEVQMKYITRQHDRNLVPALLAACGGIILLTVNVSRYTFDNRQWIVKPALVAERSGARMFSYNPRIDILMNRLQAGALYDRNGNLLATSNPQQVLKNIDTLSKIGLERSALVSTAQRRLDRYYPFAEHMFFWTGDANTGVFSGSTNGYFAEYKHAADLRGFSTPLTNFDVTATRFREERFLPASSRDMTVSEINYDALAPLLIAGMNSPQVDSFKRRNRDVHLTMDADLQTSLQIQLRNNDSLRNNRVSIVIMEDSTGDVLSSAVWPLPPINDWEKLTVSERQENNLSGWLTVRDLGFTLATQPGSTAKIATTVAAFNKNGMSALSKAFLIKPQDLIRIKGAEPDESGTIGLERGFTKSNNPYFIRLANEEQLQEEMVKVYLHTGMFLRGVGGYYYYPHPEKTDQQERWLQFWRDTEFRSLRRYNKDNIRATRGLGVSGMAWGQGELIATPASVARLAAGVANDGRLVQNRYVMKISDSVLPLKSARQIVKEPQYADAITGLMQKQSANRQSQFGIAVAGKTGTPERIYQGQRINDGWYAFFAPKAEGPGHIVVCIRIEATKGSSNAIKLAGELVIPELRKRGYIKGFGKEDKTLIATPKLKKPVAG